MEHQPINYFPAKRDGDFWKPRDKDIPIAKFKTNKSNAECRKKNKKHKKKHITKLDSSNFYKTIEWKQLRVRVFEKYGGRCMMCGRSAKEHYIPIHVDHIKPRSKYPHLALCFENLQLLCEDCNLGKGNKYETDWRPEKSHIEFETECDLGTLLHCAELLLKP